MRPQALRLALTASLFAGLLLGLGAGGASAAASELLSIAAAPPANDLFENAEVLDPVSSLRIEGTNVEATKEREPREPDHAGDSGGASVWYLWIAPASGNVRLNTCDSDFDTLLAVYTGKNLDDLTEVASDIGSCAPGSEVAFHATLDEAYFIAVDGVAAGDTPATGKIVLDLTLRPPNDDFADAQLVSGASATATGTSENATKEAGEPNHAGHPGGASIWYQWTAPASGTVSIDTCDLTSFDTLLGVYTGTSVGGLTEVASSNDACGLGSAVRISATAGQTYRIAVDRVGAQNGSVSLRIGPPPTNDAKANAQVLGSTSVTVSGSTIGASKQTGEPNHAENPGGASVWYRFTASSTQLLSVDTCDSDFDFDTLLAVYKSSGAGTGFVSLDSRASADDGCGVQSRLSFKAASGSTYLIAVDGAGGDVGAISLRLRPTPSNDDIAQRGFLTGGAVDSTASNVGASQELLEPNHAGNGGGASIWYRWQAPTNGLASVDTCGSDFDTLLGVYTLPSTSQAVTDLTEVASDDNSCGTRSRVVFDAVASNFYWIAVDGRDSGLGPAEGTAQIRINQPHNNMFADARTITGASNFVFDSNLGATKEAGEPNHAGNPGGASIWFRWTAPTSGRVVFNTCSSHINTLLAVYTGTAVGLLTPVASNDDACGFGGNQSRVGFTAVAGTTYSIAVDGFNSGAGAPQTLNIFLRFAYSPANDDFANAQLLSGSLVSVSGTQLAATKEPGEPNHAGDVGGTSVWYTWTAPVSGLVTVDTAGVAQLIAVYTGTAVGSLTPVASTPVGATSFTAVSGTTYRIAVDGPAFSTGGTAESTFELRLGQAPANDNFANGQVLSGSPVSVSGGNNGATKETGEPNHGGTITGASVWYRWTAPSNGVMVADTCDNDPFTGQLSVYTGAAVDSLTGVGTRKERCGGDIVEFTASAGTTYHLAVAGADPGGGPSVGRFELRLRPPPANDAFAARATLAGTSVTALGTNVGASNEVGEPDHLGNPGGASVWYSWTAPSSGQFTLDTCEETNFDTLLAVYTGSSLGALTELASNDDGSCSQGGSKLTFTTLATVTYVIVVEGKDVFVQAGFIDPEQGQFKLRLAPVPVTPPPTAANNSFGAAEVLTGRRVTVGGSNTNATKESGEPAHAGNAGGASVWYRWTPNLNGRVVIDTCGSGIDTLLAVYTGSAVNALTAVASNDNSCGAQSKVAFQATEGTTYRIAVDGRNVGSGAAQGSFQLRLRIPPNDDFADAEVISGLPVTATGTNIGATVESGEPSHSNWFDTPPEASVWYSWTAPATGRVAIDTCGSGFKTALGVYTGSSVGSLTRVAGTGTGSSIAACGNQSVVAFDAVASTTYQIAVDGFSLSGERPERGPITLRLAPPPPNDAFAAAETLTGSSTVAFGTNAGATVEAGEDPFHHSFAGASVWYRWTAPADGRATIDLCGSDFLTSLAVYTGSAVSSLSKLGSAGRTCGEFGDQSRLTVAVTGGTTYHVVVDGALGDPAPGSPPSRQGEIELVLELRPTNDDFANAQVLSAGTAAATGTNVNGTKEPGEPNHAGNSGGRSVWYRWIAPASGRVAIDTCGSGFDTLLAVYTGSPVGSLTPVASNNNSCGTQSKLAFQATSGTTYQIAVDGSGGAEGSLSLSLDADSPETAIDSGPSGPTNNVSPSFAFSSNEAGSTFQCRLDSSLEADFTSCTSPKGYVSLSQGPHTFEVRAIDLAGNTDPTPASRTFTVDTQPPDTMIDSGPSGPTNNASPSFAFSSNEAGSTFQCRLDSILETDFTTCTSPKGYVSLSQGPHTFDVRAIDPAGNVDPSPGSQAFNVDTQGPTVTIDSGPSGTTNDDPSFAFSAEAGATFQCRLDEETFATCTSPKAYTDLDDGSHTFRVQASDSLGNPGAEATRTFTVDTEGPTVTIDSGPSGTTNNDDPSFAFSAEAGATFQCRLDEETFATCTSPKAYTDLDDGSHTFHVQASDSLGNPGAEATRTFTVDTEGPTVTIDSGPSGTISEFSVTFTFSSEAGATFECRLNFPLSSNPFIPCSSGVEYFVTDTTYTFSVRAMDTVGNTGPETSRTWTIDTRADVTIDSGPSDPTNETSATFTFSGETGATFKCRLGSGQWTWPIETDLVPCTSPQTYTGLADGSHFFDVYATDTLGNTGAATRFWTVDTVGPGVTLDSGPSGTTNETDATFEFSAEAGATFECRLDTADFESCSSPKTYTDVTETSHTFRVRATDEAGNTGAETTGTWTVDLTGPTTTINTGPSGTVPSTNATFQFSAEAGATFECRLDAAVDFTDCSSPQSYATLLQGSHTFRVRATDTVGNTGSETTRIWIVDTIAPTTTIDSGPTGTVASANASFTFSADEAGVSFGCRRDFEPTPSPCTSPKTYAGLADGPHTFRVIAIDAAGNVGLEATRTWTIEPSLDTTDPETTIDSGPSGLTANSSPSFTFSSSETGSTFECRLDSAEDDDFSSCSSPKPYSSLGQDSHTFEVRAIDPAGNTDPTPASRTFNVDTLAPETTIESGPSGPTANSSPSFTFSSSQIGSTFQCRLDSSLEAGFTSCTSPQGYSGLGQGPHTFEVRAIDPAVNVDPSPASRTFTVDTVGPTVTVGSGPSGTTSETDASLAFSAEAGATFECRLDSSTYASCSSPKTYLDLADGPHTFRVRGADTLGNVGAEDLVSWTVAREADEPDDASGAVNAGGTVSTDGAGDGASATDPVETSVTTPVAGAVSITETPGAPAETSGYTFLGYQILITAPTATAGSPLVIVFLVDASQLPPGGAGAVVLHRDDVPIAPCSGAGATPDPCVEPPVTRPDGDGQFTVRTSEASLWAFGVAKPAAPPPPPPSPPGPAADVTPPVLQVVAAARQKLAKALKQGVLAKITCSETCTVVAELRLSKKVAKRLKLPVVVGKLQVTLAQAIAQAVKVKLIAKAKRKFAQLNSVALSLRITATDPAGNPSRASKAISLRR